MSHSPIAAAILAAGGPAVVSRALGVSVQAVCFWRDGKRRFPVELGAAFEALAGEPARRWRLWPADWHLIWPELVGSECAPPIPAPAIPSAAEARDAA